MPESSGQSDSAREEAAPCDLWASAAGSPQAGDTPPGGDHLARAKTVVKHWGEERWLVPEGSAFGFKVITIRAGRRTSLQYHRHKEEANLVAAGEGRIYLAESPQAPLRAYPLDPGRIVHIRPGTVHRVEAVTDLTLVEVSTPELDDVIRLEDDLGRGNGRIEAEHRPGP
jgi:mannose-6-phosphate isomerase-like protein (cupin superfamily)